MRRYLVFVVALIAAGCSNSSTSPSSEKLSVVATAYPLYEAAAAVGGDRAHASNLLPLDPFGEVSEDKAQQLRDASLAVVLGKGTQPAVDKIVEQRTGPTLRILDSIETKPSLVGPGVDPYVWLDPKNMGTITNLITAQLTKMDPEGKATFAKNAKHHGHSVAGVDKAYAQTIATCPEKTVVTDAPLFQYMTDRYGLQQVDATKLPTTTGVDADPLRVAIDTYHPTTIFRLTLPTLSEARDIKEKYGVKVAVLDPIAAQTDQARRGGANYANVMHLNLDALRTALSCTADPIPGK